MGIKVPAGEVVEHGMSTPGAAPPAAGIFALPLSIFSRVWRDASWSLAGNLLTVASGVATLKIIGRLVPAADYGAASLVLGVCALLNQFIAGPLISERIRLYFDQMALGNKRPLSAALVGLLLRTSVLIATVYVAIAAIFYYRGQHVYLQLWLPVLLLVFMQPQLAAGLAQLEAQREYRSLSFAQPLINVLQVPLLLGLLWMAISGATVIVWAQALAAALVFCVLAMLVRRHAVAPASSEHKNPLAQASITSFGWSLYLFNLSSWILATSDRYLIDHFLHRSDVGVYVVNYAFWSIPFVVLNGWINSFARPRLYGRAADSSWGRVFRVTMATVGTGAALAIAGTGLIYLVGRPIALWVLGEKYWHSESLMMIICSAHIFFLIGHTASTYFLAIKSSHWVWISSLIAALINIGLNVLFLPTYGVVAAAWATFGAYAVWSILSLGGVFYWSRRLAGEPPAAAPTASPRKP
jgi:O-antigen/teichoic acid export membrane protein